MRSPGPADHRLLSLYRRYLGEPERRTDVFVGFGLFFGGIALGALGLLLFLANVVVTFDAAYFWQLREIAIVFATIGLPALLLSVVILLPVSNRAVYISLGGVAICVVATGIFVATYPQEWNVMGTDYSPVGITVYAGGLTVLLGSTGAALVAHHLERTHPNQSTVSEPSTSSNESPVTDEEVDRDIEESVAASDLTWGGVEPAETRRLTLSVDEAEEDIDATGLDVVSDVRTDDGVEDSVTALKQLRGWEPPTERGDGIDDQADALRALRERTANEAEEAGIIRTVVDRFRRK